MTSFYHTVVDSDSLVKCPYDPVHVVRQKKLTAHITKCKKNFPGVTIVTCPFNAQHSVRDDSLRHHMGICPNKDTIDALRPPQLPDPMCVVGGTLEVPTYFPGIVDEEEEEVEGENWDAAGDGLIPTGVNPRELAGVGKYKILTGMQPFAKKLYYENLRKEDPEANVKLFQEPVRKPAPTPGGGGEGEASTQVNKPFPTHGRGRGMKPTARDIPASSPAGLSKPVPPSMEELEKSCRRTKKKLKQISHLLDRQANGDTLNDEEKIKVAHKALYESQYSNLLSQIKEREAPGQFDDVGVQLS